MKSLVLKTILAAIVLWVHFDAQAAVIRFPDEELATETVLPVFDNPVSVRNRNVVTSRRFELGGNAGYMLTEPFFNPVNVSGSLSYHLNEDHGVNLFGTFFLSGVSQNTENLNNPAGSTDGVRPNLQFAPRPRWLLLANYQFTGYYGKISLSKDSVMNLSLLGTAGVGGYYIGDQIFPTFSVGLGQKFYFTPNFGIRFDLRVLMYQGPDVLSGNKLILANANSEVSSDRFNKRLFISSILTAGVIWLIPGT